MELLICATLVLSAYIPHLSGRERSSQQLLSLFCVGVSFSDDVLLRLRNGTRKSGKGPNNKILKQASSLHFLVFTPQSCNLLCHSWLPLSSLLVSRFPLLRLLLQIWWKQIRKVTHLACWCVFLFCWCVHEAGMRLLFTEKRVGHAPSTRT